MKHYYLNIVLFLFIGFSSINAQQPWTQPLKYCTGSNGTTFSNTITFQDSSGVPSVIRIGTSSSDTLIAAFQWFPAPMSNPKWDKVAVKFSYNGGTTWTTPTTCTFINLPGGFQRPFDPCLMKLSNGQIKMYFSGAVNSPTLGQIDSYGAISNDGITYTVQSPAIFNDPTKNVIDPTVTSFSNTYQYVSWSGVQSDGAYRAISSDAITFTTQPLIPFDNTHLWLGNLMVDGGLLKFYGCGNGPIWVNSSSTGSAWNGYTVTNISTGADPAVVKNKSGQYLMIFTGQPYTTSVSESVGNVYDFKAYPIPCGDHVFISSPINSPVSIEIYDTEWRLVKSQNYDDSTREQKIELKELGCGIFYLKCKGEKKSEYIRLVKTQ